LPPFVQQQSYSEVGTTGTDDHLIAALAELARHSNQAFRRGVFAERASNELQVLLVLAARGRARVPEIASDLEIDRSTSRHALSRLLADGLVTELSDPDDGRRSFFEPTRSGRSLLARYLGGLPAELRGHLTKVAAR
jgi:DNA-binding MarR family transcriptional regulator